MDHRELTSELKQCFAVKDEMRLTQTLNQIQNQLKIQSGEGELFFKTKEGLQDFFEVVNQFSEDALDSLQQSNLIITDLVSIQLPLSLKKNESFLEDTFINNVPHILLNLGNPKVTYKNLIHQFFPSYPKFEFLSLTFTRVVFANRHTNAQPHL